MLFRRILRIVRFIGEEPRKRQTRCQLLPFIPDITNDACSSSSVEVEGQECIPATEHPDGQRLDFLPERMKVKVAYHPGDDTLAPRLLEGLAQGLLGISITQAMDGGFVDEHRPYRIRGN